MRLLAFAFITEIPYDIAFGNQINYIANTNIFYTLFLGGMAITLYERFKERRGWQTMALLTAILPTVMLAQMLSVDYGSMGVLFIFAMYAIKPRTPRLIAFGVFTLSQFFPLVAAYFMGIEVPLKYLMMIPFALATVPLIIKYNGERGRKAKWLFYVAYPAHLAVFAVVAMITNN